MKRFSISIYHSYNNINYDTMKKYLVMFCLLSMSMIINSQNKYVSIENLKIINKIVQTPNIYHRIDTASYKIDLVPLTQLRFSAGIATVFSTNSKKITLKWKSKNNRIIDNMSIIAQKGFDLYILKEREWVFAGCVTCKNKGQNNEETIVDNMVKGNKTCLLYFPLFDEISSLSLGVDRDAYIKSIDCPFQHKIVFMGSSIIHGAAASRPGMALPARMERLLNMEIINLGTSGCSKLQPYMAQIISDNDADAYIFDVFSNPSPKEINERLEKFIHIIRTKHPFTPLIFIQTEIRENTNFNSVIKKYEYDKRSISEKLMKRLIKRDKNIYFLDPGLYIGNDHEATVDGIHPSDLGFTRIMRKLVPKIKKILNKYGIR